MCSMSFFPTDNIVSDISTLISCFFLIQFMKLDDDNWLLTPKIIYSKLNFGGFLSFLVKKVMALWVCLLIDYQSPSNYMMKRYYTVTLTWIVARCLKITSPSNPKKKAPAYMRKFSNPIDASCCDLTYLLISRNFWLRLGSVKKWSISVSAYSWVRPNERYLSINSCRISCFIVERTMC